MKDRTKVITGPNTVFSYLNVNEPKTPIGGGTPKYSASLIIPKTDTRTVEKIMDAIQAAYEEGQTKLKGTSRTVPALSAIKNPLRDGDAERPGDEAYRNSYFLNANSTTKPGVVRIEGNSMYPITDTSELYSGIIGRASISFYAFNTNGNRGIAVSLNNILKLSDGKPLGGHSRPEDDFAGFLGEDEDGFLN